MGEPATDGSATRPHETARESPPSAQSAFSAVATRVQYRPRQMIFHEGGRSGGLYLVCSGAVRLQHSDRLGRQHVLGVAGPGAVLGEFALDPEEPLSISAEALTASQLAFLPRERFDWFVRRHPESAVWLMDALCRELARARRRVRDLALKGAEARLAELLLELAGSGGGRPGQRRIALRYRRREMAEMIGVSTETVIRLLARLQAKGVISVRRRDLAVTDGPALARIALGDAGV